MQSIISDLLDCMEDKVHNQASAFFAEEKKYQRFQEYLHNRQIDPRRVPFTELSFHVCGYGYFEKYKQHMKLKFREYLWQSTNACPELSVLKIVFNGFVVNSIDNEREEAEEIKANEQHILFDILESIEEIVKKRKIKVFHFHTTNLRKCSEKDLTKIFKLINMFGTQGFCEQISIQLTDWQFEGGYPEYIRLYQIFTDFVAGKPESLRFKKFRLEMSSWYMKQKEAYKLLSKTLTVEQLVQKFKKEQKPVEKDKNEKPNPDTPDVQKEEADNMNDVVFPHLPQEQRQETMEALVYFLENLDKRYHQPKYPHKKNSEKFDGEEYKAHGLMIQEMKRTEEIVSQRLVKYPVEFIMGLRVEEFHSKMTAFLGNLLTKMTQLNEYHIDMRNWNGMLSMPGLKKILDTKVISNKQEFSLIRRSLVGGGGKLPAKEGEELKTIYTM